MSERIRDWIEPFLVAHGERFKVHDWPFPGCDEYIDFVGDWIEAFAGLGVSQDESNRASRRLALNPPNWRRDHLPAVMATVKAMRADRGQDTSALTRESALSASRNCPHCGGGGLAPVVNRDPANKPPHCGSHCVCPMGRWMRTQLAQKYPEDIRRIPDFQECLSGQSMWVDRELFYGETYADMPCEIDMKQAVARLRDHREKLERTAS